VAKFPLVLATIADFALAALLVAVSGFMFGGGPESMHAGFLAAAGYVAAVIACLAAPIAGFAFNRRGKAGLGLTTACVPVAGALAALIVPAPY
jgi:hypothetical protein